MSTAPLPTASLTLLGVKTVPILPHLSSHVEDYLKHLSIALTNIVNTRDFTTPTLHNMKSRIDITHEAGEHSMKTTSKEGLIEYWRKLMEACPQFHTEILDATCVVDERFGYGKVWILRTCSGLPDGLIRECVAEMSWERNNEDWFLSGYRGLRGFVWPGNEVCYHSVGSSDFSPGSLDLVGGTNG